MNRTRLAYALAIVALALSPGLLLQRAQNEAVKPPARRTEAQTKPPALVRADAETGPAPLIPAERAVAPLPLAQDPFREAPVVASRETVPDEHGRFERVRVIRTRFKYPFVRVAESGVRDRDTGREKVFRREERVADHVLVKLRPGTKPDELKALAERHGMKIRRRMFAPGVYLVATPAADLDSVEKAIEAFRRESDSLAYAEPDYIVHVSATPNDPRFPELWGLHNTGQTGGLPDADIDAPEAWDLATGSRSVKVGVIDTGVDYTHEDLAANLWTNPGEIPGNGVDDDGNGLVDDVRGWNFAYDNNDPQDDHYHGTHVAGTIGAVGNNGLGVAGVCWQVTLVPIKFLDGSGSGTFSDAADAITYATRVGVHLTSNSWGGYGFSQGLKDAVDAADQAGVLFVAAAGNDAADTDVAPHYPSSFANANILSVASTTASDDKSSFSNYGLSSVDLGAPGSAILSCGPGNTYRVLSGTSMATPHVAGVCALLKSVAPGLSASEIKSQVLGRTDPKTSLSGRTVTGGRLNAFRAIQFSSQPALSFKEGRVEDASGNGDGFINPGERVNLYATLRNLGTSSADGVTATLSLSGADPNVSLVQTSASFGTVPALGTATSAQAYVFDVAPACPTPHPINLVLTIQDGAGGLWTSPFAVTVQSSYLITGTVRLDGAPLSGATVSWSGPLSGSVATAADGTYRFGTLAGTYGLVARKTGFRESSAVTVTVPPAPSAVDFNFTTSTVGGRVRDAGTGTGIAGAAVTYTGDFAGSVTTQADGTYALSFVTGQTSNVSLRAGKPGIYFESLPIAVTIPPNAPGTDFALQGAPDVNVVPASFDVTANLGDVPTRTLTLSNVLGGTLTYRFENHVSAYATADRGDILRVLRVPGHGVAFDGAALWTSHWPSPILDRVDPNDGFLLGRLNLTGVVQQPWALAWDGANLWVADWGTKKVFCINPATGQSVRSFNSPEGLVPAGIDVGANALYVYVYRTLYKLDPVTGQTLGRVSLPVELNVTGITVYDNSVWCSSNVGDVHEVSLVDGSVLRSWRGPDQGSGGVVQLWGISRDNRGSLWISSQNGLFQVATGRLHWLRETPDLGSVPGSGSQAVTVTLNSTAAGTGVHRAFIHVKSNDPDEPDVSIPVTFTVVSAGNGPPTAQSQSLTLAPEAEMPITLSATDPNGDVLTYSLSTLPTGGLLTGVPPNLLYSPFPSFTGTDGFTFKANDGSVDSNVAGVTVTVQGVPDIGVAPLSVSVTGAQAGQIHTRSLTVSNPGSRKLTVRLSSRSATGGANPRTPGTVLRTLDISALYPSWTPVHPEIGPQGIAFDGEGLWVASTSSWQRPESVLLKVDPLDGRLVRTLDLKGRCDPEQLSWDGANLWATNFTARGIYCIDPRTGDVIRTLTLPAPDLGGATDNKPRGAVRVGTVVYVLGEWTHSWYRSWWVYLLDAVNGTFLGKYGLPRSEVGGPENGEYPFGLTYASGSLWTPSFTGSQPGKIYEMREDGLVRGSFAAPDRTLMGIAPDGEGNLWVTARETRKLYLIDSGKSPWLRVQPRSLTVAPGGSASVTLTLDANFSGPGYHTAELTFESNDPDERALFVPVALGLTNEPPVADAGPDSVMPENGPGLGATVYLNGYRSRDPDAPIASYVWKQGTTTVGTGPSPAVTLASGTHILTLTVTDSEGLTATDTVHVTVAPLPSGLAQAWGVNGSNQLGDGTATDRTTPVQVSGPLTVTAVDGGSVFSLGLKPDHSLWSWGDNAYGQLGDGTLTRRATPVPVSGMTDVRTFSAGQNHTLAVRRDRTVWSWGLNASGQLGDGTFGDRRSPVFVQGLSEVVAVAAGWAHSLALRADGTVWAWGSNGWGRLGDASFITPQVRPVRVYGLDSVVAIAAGEEHSAALRSDGTIWTWGSNLYGQLGLGVGAGSMRMAPAQVPSLTGVRAIACGGRHTLALKVDGTVWAWGQNGWGQLGDGTNTDRPSPVQVSSLSGVSAVSAGFLHSMAIRSDGIVWGWGGNTGGSLGDGTFNNRSVPVQVTSLTGAWSVVASRQYHSVAFAVSGTTFSISGTVTEGGAGLAGVTVSIGARSATTSGTGAYTVPAVPNGTYALRAIKPGYGFTPSGWANPVVVGGANLTNRNFTAVTGGNGGLAAGGAGPRPSATGPFAWAWGLNSYGQLGNGTTSDQASPAMVQGLADLPDVLALGGGGDHSLALKSNGTVWSWGRNLYGQLGDGSTVDRMLPQQISSLAGVAAVAAGAQHSLALKSDGTVWAWGRNTLGQLGDGTTTDRALPVQVSGLAGVTALAAGAHHNLALRSDGTVWAWGSNGTGRLGDGTTLDRAAPVQVVGLSGVLKIAAGHSHSLAATSDGSAWAWGNNWAGQLGNGSTDPSLTPTRVAGLPSVRTLSAGLNHSLALALDGTVWAWGYNTGGLLPEGLSLKVRITIPEGGSATYTGELFLSAPLAGDLTVSLASSDTTELGVRSPSVIPAGTTWGSFEYFAVNDLDADGVQKVTITATSTLGTISAHVFVEDDESLVAEFVNLTLPRQVSGLSGVVGVAAGSHSLAVKSDGSVWAWGLNSFGQLGVGGGDRKDPAQVTSLADVGGVWAGWYHSQALKRVTSPFQQDGGADGLVVIEAESYSSKADQGGHAWTPASAVGAAGAGSLEATPNNGALVNTAYATGSPRLDFPVNFTRTGTHYVWIRGIGPTGNDDSCHAGLDGQEWAASDRITGFGASWTWSKSTMDGAVASFDVPSAGFHTVNVWMREDGFVLDRILLTTNAAYAPSGPGPGESARWSANQPPSVGITSPANGAAFVAPATVTINATASDPDGTVSKVEFYQGSTKLGEDLSSPYAFVWSGVGVGTYSLTAVATDFTGGSSASAPVSITVNVNQPPTAGITSPASGATFTAPASITLNATASDPDTALTKVEFFQGVVKLGEDTSAPYSFTWSGVAAGAYSLTAVATDDRGATGTSPAVNVTVTAAGGSGTVLRQWWTGISGTAVSSLTGHSNYPGSVTGSDQPTLFESPVNWADNYGTRMRGYVHPPASGSYVFWIASDDNSELWLSTDDTPLNKVKIAWVTDWTSSREWTKYASQQSAPVSLVGGNRYYIEALQKEGGGGDNLAAGWQLPDATIERPIPGNRLSPFDPASLAVVTVSSDDASASEPGSDTARFLLMRSVNTAGTLTVTYAVNGTATPNTDYWTLSGSVTFAPGQTTVAVPVTPKDDAAVEGSETVTLTVSPGAGYEGGNPAAGTVTIADNDAPAGPQALFVVGNTVLNAGDSAVQSRLQALGYTVTVRAATAAVTADATGKAVVLISSTVLSGDVNTKFRDVAVPVVVWESSLYDDMKMTDLASGTHYGTTASQTALSIVNASHAMAAGLSGVPTIMNVADTFTWGVPNGNAANVATLASDATKSVLFGYESGATMFGMNAPARRVGLFLQDATAAGANANGMSVIDAAIRWATNAPPTVSITSPASGATFTAPASITINATASDANGSVTKVEFYQGSTKLGEDSTSPYGFAWTGVAAGAYTLTAKAVDNVGEVTTSAPVTVTVNGLPTVTISVNDASASEAGPDQGQFTITRTGSTSSPLAVAITPSGTATNGTDYNSLSTTATIPGGQASTTVTVFPIDDAAVEGNETVVVTLAAGSGYTVGSPSSGTVTIADNDAAPKTALFVVGNATLSPADAAAQSRLQTLGYAVTVRQDAASTGADATGKTLVVVSSTVASGNVNTKFRTVAVPVLNWESALMDDFGMAGMVNGTDYGTIASQTTLSVLNSSHPMAAGLTGTPTVVTASSTFTWGVPNANAVKIASVTGNSARCVIFGYLSGAAMPGLTAPARRVGFFLENTTPSSLNAGGWALFDAAVNWSVGTGTTSLGAFSASADITVNGQGNYVTVQEAVDAARPGDTVELAAARYYVPEGVRLKGGVSIRGIGPLRTILDGQGAPAVLRLTGTAAEGRSVVELLTVTGGATGVDTAAGDAILRNLQVVKTAGDGVVAGQAGTVTGVSLTVADNGGDGLKLHTPRARFRGLIVARNGGQGIHAVAGGTVAYSTSFGNGAGSDSYAGTISFRNAAALDYREAAGSVSVDAGDPEDPYDREPAPNGSRANQGAFGNTSEATPSGR